MLNERSRRISDLFVEGTELYLGQDSENKPTLIWVNKLNSFEVEQARHDGVVARGLKIARLAKPDNAELIGMRAQLEAWTDKELLERRVDQQMNALQLEAFNDVEIEHRDLMDRIRRGPEILADRSAGPDDPARKQLAEDQKEYATLLQAAIEKQRRNAFRDAEGLSREDLEKDFLDEWRERESLEEFMEERRVTELHIAMRDCRGTEVGVDAEGGRLFDHADCDHNQRLYAREEIRSLPDALTERVIETLESITVSIRDAGNSAAPASSSESLERPSNPEDSKPSIPVETSPAVPTT